MVLDVVFNHTNEGNHEGPVINFKGFCNEVYYYLSQKDRQYYMDYSGCGNTMDCNHPVVTKMIVDCLEYWVRDMHVDHHSLWVDPNDSKHILLGNDGGLYQSYDEGADWLHINNVAVRDSYRRLGIGRLLLNRILEAGKQSGVPHAFLELRAGNTAALALYEGCGFHVTSRRSKYYSEPVEDALVMMIQLVQALDPL